MPEATPARRLAAALLAAIGLAAPDARACGGDWIVADVIDGDTLRIVNPALPPPLDALSLRLLGVDAPKRAAAPDAGRGRSRRGRHRLRPPRPRPRRHGSVVLARWGKWGGRVLGRVAVDGRDLATLLIRAGHAAPYGGGSRRSRCGPFPRRGGSRSPRTTEGAKP